LTNHPKELRPLTVMFCDLVGSSILGSEMDPEDFTDLIAAFFQHLIAIVATHNGFFGRMQGDGALVYFGYPAAQDDDTDRAVRAALDIVAKFSSEPVQGRWLQVRIGISSGLVIVGDVVGTGDPQNMDVSGETPNLAARLQAMAEPNTVLVSDSVRRLVGARFEFRDLGGKEIKGWWDPIRVWQAVRQVEHITRFEARGGTIATPLLGREGTLDHLLSLWRHASAGSGITVLLRGEAGIGKSRLVAEILRSRREVPAIRLFCAPHQTTMALQPVIDHLESTARITRSADAATQLSRLRALIPGADPIDLRLIAELLLIDTTSLPALPVMNPGRRRARLIQALVAYVTRQADRGPLLAVLEDAHWADPSTLEFVSACLTAVATLPMMLIITTRPEPRLEWQSQEGITPLNVERLSFDRSVELVREVARDAPLPQQVVRDIAERAEGVPLYIEELTKAVAESLAQAPAGRVGPGERQRGQRTSVPMSIHASLLARLDRLGAAKGVAEVASVIGREFTLALLEPASGLAREGLADALDRLVEAGIVERMRAGSESYRFRHALLQDAAYGMMTRDLRRSWHRRIAETLEQALTDGAAGRPQLLAHHWSEANEPRKAAAWWLYGARQTLDHLAPAEALAQVERGLAELGHLPEDADRWQTEVGLQLLAGNALLVTTGHAARQTGAAFARALALCERRPATPLRMDATFGFWNHLAQRGELLRAQELAENMLAFGISERNSRWRLAGLRACGQMNFIFGRFNAAIDVLRQGIELWYTEHPSGGLGTVHDPGVINMHCYASFSLTFVGKIAESRREAAAAVRTAQAAGHHLIVAQSIFTEAVLAMYIGEADQARRLMEQTLAYSEEHGVVYFIMFGSAYLGTMEGHAGDLKSGLEKLRSAIAIQRASSTVSFMPGFLAREGELLTLAGQVPEALACFAEALAITEQTSSRWDEATNRRLYARTIAADGRPEDAEAELRKALAIAAAQGAHLIEVEVASDLAAALAAKGRTSEGAALLQRALGWFGSDDAIPVIVQARQVLTRITSRLMTCPGV
jgi:class 3 adenylate cyclase/tetratricopeptide (TPR) repeat protein